MSSDIHSMAPAETVILSPNAHTARTSLGAQLSIYLELAKPRILIEILLIALVGFGLATSNWRNILLVHLSLGITLLAAGTGSLNQWMERDIDSEMRRTERRPLPANRISSLHAGLFGAVTSVLGIGYLALLVNPLSGLLGLATVLSYVFIYTPLKRKTPHSTFIGAFPGAMPPVMGLVAVQNRISKEALILFFIMFLWQFPHFLAIAWMYREDYARAGIKMLPIVEPDGVSTGKQIVIYGLLLVPVSLLPTFIGLAGMIYLVGALLLSLVYLYFGILAARNRERQQARQLLLVSVIYLPLLFILMLLDKTHSIN